MKKIGWRFFLIAGALLAAGYIALKANTDALPVWLGGEPEIAVRIAPVRSVTVPMTVQVKGEVSTGDQSQVLSRLPGKVTEVRFKEGEWVDAGAVVATINSSTIAQRAAELETALAAAQENLKAKDEQLGAAERHLDKTRDLYRQDLIARRDLEQAQAGVETARATMELARAQRAQQEAMLAQVRVLRGLTTLRAPMSGIVIRRFVEPGAAISESSPVLTIGSVDTLKIIGKVSDIDRASVREGMLAEVSNPAVTGQPLSGKVARLGPISKSTERLSEVEIELVNPQRTLHAGMNVEASILLDRERKILLLPRAGVLSANGNHYVFKFAEGRAVRAPIEIGAERNAAIEIKLGLKEGDWVIVEDLTILKSGDRVRSLPKLTRPAQE
jgi:RND family efflux transporter MFP subunit